MFKKKRLVIVLSLVALGWVAWQVDVVFALGCLGAALLLMLLLKGGHILGDRMGMAKLKTLEKFNYAALERALPSPPRARPWRFVVLGDTRNNTAIATELYRKTRELAPVMAFHTGDIVRGGKAGELYRNHVRVVEANLGDIPFFCAPGNHERGPMRDYAAFKTLYGDDRFAFAHDECLFVGFNNCLKSGVSDADLEFMESHLAEQYAYKFVFTHIPPAFFEACFVKDVRRRGFKKNGDAFHRLMRRHQVDEVFFAHIHGYATEVLDGVRYTLTAGGGAPLSKRIVPENRHYHLVEMEIAEDGVKRTLRVFEAGRWAARTIAP